MEICRRCGHERKLHIHECPCAPGKKMCQWSKDKMGCTCSDFKEEQNV